MDVTCVDLKNLTSVDTEVSRGFMAPMLHNKGTFFL